MKIKVLTIVSIAMMVATGACASQKCNTSQRIGSKVIKKGDSERRVLELKPDRESEVQSKLGLFVGLRFDFYKSRSTIQVYVKQGIVTDVCIVRE